jgi:hypothetical protein
LAIGQGKFLPCGEHRNGAAKRRPTPRCKKQFERIARLSVAAKQRIVIEMLDGVLAQTNR